MTDDEATPEGTPAPDMFAELSEGSELVQQEVLPVVREVQQYIASQRDIQDELQRSIESERKFRDELARSVESERASREALLRSVESERVERERAARGLEELERAAKAARTDIEALLTSRLFADDRNRLLSGLSQTDIKAFLATVSEAVHATGLSDLRAGIRIVSEARAGTWLTGAGTMTIGGPVAPGATLAGESSMTAGGTVYVADRDHLRMIEVSEKVEVVTREVARHGIATLSTAQLLIAIIIMLVIGLGTAEAVGPASIGQQVKNIGELASLAASLTAIVLVYDNRKR